MRKEVNKKRAICFALACILLVGTISVGLMTYSSNDTFVDSNENNDQQVFDYFYAQIYDSNDQIVSKYKVTLTGTVSNTSREITSVSFSYISGDTCETGYNIDGDTATAFINHPTEGYLAWTFTLSESGVFSMR